ncbi:MAG: hypothetical protein JO352_35425 [Chloroflexi bacterium]|nr:hypothetical protein [Chloroflexota bacterium]MBV9599993.1 hypothetical protein [Chloroflexota bacterium]
MAELTPDMVRLLVGVELDDATVTALIEWYASLARGLAAFPEADLKGVEPPLRSTAGPLA